MPLPIIIFFLLIPILLWAFITFDNLIKLEHQKFHFQWMKDGEPSGMYWRPANFHRSFRNGMATQKSMLLWLFKNPKWVESSDEASKLLKRYRVLVLAWNICIILWAFFGLRFLA
jgi:hypothetical protein